MLSSNTLLPPMQPEKFHLRRQPSHAAFSLVELIFVVHIIGLLVAITGPSLSHARQRSQQTVCLERLGMISKASRIYQESDPSDWMIPAHPLQFDDSFNDLANIGAYEWGGKSGIGFTGFAERGGSGILSSRYGTAARCGPDTRPLNKILYPSGFRNNFSPWDRIGALLDTQLDLELYHCPADNGPPLAAHCSRWVRNPGRSSYDHFGTSYAANKFSTQLSGQLYSNSPYMRPASRVPNPSRTIAYEENIGRWAWASRREIDGCLWIGLGVWPGPTKAIKGWHGKNWSFNRSFVDTHAEMQSVYIESTEDVEGYANHYRNEIVFPDDRTKQESYRCIIVRGDGWQKDTLPAPIIPIGIFYNSSGRPSYEGCVRSQ